MTRVHRMAAVAALLLLPALAACDDQQTAEKTGQEIGRAVDQTAERAGEVAGDAAREAGRWLQDAGRSLEREAKGAKE
ncbi:hypothetical protein [Azospirillum sp.]|uniref:hypothetical protein n=1 Tax=Azospirillum sp. TaxID=34012 RepID=UPI002D652560|nr:hypothetical protein [Azospirillum sp.]HYD66666.1 hypothetical protein [Azospirillum sp.]